MTLIEAKNLQKIYSNEEVDTIALKTASLSINMGEFIAIIGPSGSGKSTLMHLLGFLAKPTKGDYAFKNKRVDKLSEDEMAELRNKEIGFVFQSFNLLPRTSVVDNVKLPLTYSTKSQKERQRLVNKAIKEVELDHRKEYLSNQLSGGEKQRVAIARALVNEPNIIFADEPTGNLDSKTGATIMKILQKLNREGKTIIIVTHEKETAAHAKRIIQLKDGEIISDKQVKNRVIAKDGKRLNK